MRILYGKRSIGIKTKQVSFFGKFTGLMFNRGRDVLLFDFGKEVRYSIHSLFVFYPFLALWLDSNNKVLDYKTITPFRFGIKPKKSFRKLIEIPFNRGNKRIFGFFVDKGNI